MECVRSAHERVGSKKQQLFLVNNGRYGCHTAAMATIVLGEKNGRRWKKVKRVQKMEYAGYTNEPHLRFFNADAIQHSQYKF